MQHNDSTEQSMNRVRTEEFVGSCRNHLESVQNLRYLISLEVDNPQQVRLHLRMMDWHLRNLSEVMLQAFMNQSAMSDPIESEGVRSGAER
jgi:hypothetical protein